VDACSQFTAAAHRTSDLRISCRRISCFEAQRALAMMLEIALDALKIRQQ